MIDTHYYQSRQAIHIKPCNYFFSDKQRRAVSFCIRISVYREGVLGL
jgi:hypothetical protein